MTSADVNPYYTQPSYQGKRFHLVINDSYQPSYEDHFKFVEFKNKIFIMYVFCNELAPSTLHPHTHVYIELKSQTKLSTVVNYFVKFFNIHPYCAGCYSTRSTNLQYLSKEGNLQFVKSPPEENRLLDKLSKPLLEVIEEDPSWILKNAVPFFAIKKNLPADYSPIESCCKKIFWFWGETKTGKTHYARHMENRLYKEANLKFWQFPIQNTGTHWFDGYIDQQLVLFEELRGDSFRLSTLLLLLDQYPIPTPIKGGFTKFQPAFIWITSPMPPHLMFPNVYLVSNGPVTS
jgi:hypothetical protein